MSIRVKLERCSNSQQDFNTPHPALRATLSHKGRGSCVVGTKLGHNISIRVTLEKRSNSQHSHLSERRAQNAPRTDGHNNSYHFKY
jgi:hypothetical protein